MEQNRCPGCMNIKSGGAVCEHCGFDERRQNAPHQLQIGTALQDRYLVGRALGQGGFGITYLGWNRYLEKKVAIKEYYPAIFVDRNATYDTTVVCRTEQMEEFFAENRMRFLREAKTLAKLEEVPQIVSILDFFEANNTAYIVMEYLQGSDLRAYVKKKGGRLSPTETFNIMRPVMAALVKVHEAGLVHRDISPDNIMLQYDGSVKLMDFGAVRSVNNAAVDKELTEATQAIVKHGFAPVEQYSAKGSIGPWTDEYALCATMYYCMTGKVPENVHDRIDEDKDIDWDTVAGLTDRQKEILQKGMAIRAKDRHHDIRQLMEALFNQPAPKPEPLKPEPPKPEPLKPELPTPKKSGKKKMFLLLGAVFALVVALGIGIGFGGGKKTQASQQSLVSVGFQQDTISADSFHTVGLKEDGTVVAVGSNDFRQCDVSGWKDIVSISAGGNHTVGLKTDGTVVAAGSNSNGQCEVSDWREIVAVSAGRNHTVGLKADGTVVAVGDNRYGQCKVSGWRDIVAVSAGAFHTVGLKENGTVVAVGSNNFGQCKVSGWWDIVAVSAGTWHTIGLKSDGTVVAVGDNRCGQCKVSGWWDIVAVSAGTWYTIGLKSDGTVVATGDDNDERCNVSGWRDIIAVSVGEYHTVGLKADGTVVAVGKNDYGQCDVSGWRDIAGGVQSDSKEVPSEAPTEAPTEAPMEPRQESVYAGFQQSTISTGAYNTVGVKVDGTVVTVGWNGYGQCNVSGWQDIVAISVEKHHTVGLKADGTVVAVGRNQYGQCEVSDWRDIVAISTGEYRTVGLKADGTVVAVGRNQYGQCNVSGWEDIVAISAGNYYTLGLKSDGTVVAVGDNYDDVSGWQDIVAVSAGDFHTVGLKSDGTVVAVGKNDYGQCDVSGWRDIIAVSTGNFHTIGLKSDGTVVAAGSNTSGQCDVSGWRDIVAVSAGYNKTVGLKIDGTVVAAGLNDGDVSVWRDIKRP